MSISNCLAMLLKLYAMLFEFRLADHQLRAFLCLKLWKVKSIRMSRARCFFRHFLISWDVEQKEDEDIARALELKRAGQKTTKREIDKQFLSYT